MCNCGEQFLTESIGNRHCSQSVMRADGLIALECHTADSYGDRIETRSIRNAPECFKQPLFASTGIYRVLTHSARSLAIPIKKNWRLSTRICNASRLVWPGTWLTMADFSSSIDCVISASGSKNALRSSAIIRFGEWFDGCCAVARVVAIVIQSIYTPHTPLQRSIDSLNRAQAHVLSAAWRLCSPPHTLYRSLIR